MLSHTAAQDIGEAIRRAFLSLDAEMQAEMTSFPMPKRNVSEKVDNPRSGGVPHVSSGARSERGNNATLAQFANPGDELAGSTGIVVLLREHMLYCGNAGDSRAVCSRCGVAEPLSTDHKPTLPGERERITAAGGWVDANRVNGNLALSRAFGDFVFKRNPRQTAENQIVCANPDVYSRRLHPEEDEFIVLCCDGVWDVMTNQEVISFIRLRLSHGVGPVKVSAHYCISPFTYLPEMQFASIKRSQYF